MNDPDTGCMAIPLQTVGASSQPVHLVGDLLHDEDGRETAHDQRQAPAPEQQGARQQPEQRGRGPAHGQAQHGIGPHPNREYSGCICTGAEERGVAQVNGCPWKSCAWLITSCPDTVGPGDERAGALSWKYERHSERGRA